ncbi:MAG: hypothetical protein FIB03_11380 [Anaerolineae bacterium]|nr:hypothetical protein [Anaerolineae bacterium]
MIKQKPARDESVAGGRSSKGQASLRRDVCREARLFRLNKNATDMGTSAAVVGLNQKTWLNCNAETRPCGYSEQVPMLI